MSLRTRTTSLYRRVVEGFRRIVRGTSNGRDAQGDEKVEPTRAERTDAEPAEGAVEGEDDDRPDHPIEGDHPGLFVRTGVEL